MEITEHFIREKYDIAHEQKEVHKQIDIVMWHINEYSFKGTYKSFTDFLTQVRDSVEKDYPQIYRAGKTYGQFLQLQMIKDDGELYCECKIFQKQLETEIETIQRLMRREKNLKRHEKNEQHKHEMKILLYKKLKAELGL